MGETYFQGFTRVDDTEVLVEFSMTPITPAVIWGPHASPEEGGEVEIISVHTDADGWAAKWSDEENEVWCDWIEKNIKPEDLGDYPDYYDD